MSNIFLVNGNIRVIPPKGGGLSGFLLEISDKEGGKMTRFGMKAAWAGARAKFPAVIRGAGRAPCPFPKNVLE